MQPGLGDERDEKLPMFASAVMGFMCILGSVIWCVINGVLILTCSMTDGNGYAFYS